MRRGRRTCALGSAQWPWGSASPLCIMSACRRCIWPGQPIRSRLSSPPRWRFRWRRARLRCRRSEPSQSFAPVFAAVVLGLAISGMHYTAMAGMRLDPLCFDATRFVGAESALSRNTLALLATVIASGSRELSCCHSCQSARRRRISRRQRRPRLPSPPPPRVSTRPPPRRYARCAARRCAGRPPRREKWSRLGHRYRRHLRHPRQCTLHLCPRRRARIFLQSVDQCAGSAARSRPVLSRPPQLYRPPIAGDEVKRAGEAAFAELGEPVRCSIPVARGQYREVRERLRLLSHSVAAAPHEMRQSG